MCTSVLINCTEIIQFTVTELGKQLQNSARYEFAFPFLSPLSFATSFLHVSIPQCSIAAAAAAAAAAAPLRIRTSTLSIFVSVVYSHLSPK